MVLFLLFLVLFKCGASAAGEEFAAVANSVVANAGTGKRTRRNPQQTLLRILNNAAGVYIDPQRQSGELKKTIILTATNDGFVDFTLNLHCYMKSLGLSMLVLALDRISHRKFKQLNVPSYFVHGNTSFEITPEKSSWAQNNYNNIMIRRLEGLVSILSLGYNIVFIDTDVVFLQDPIPKLMYANIDWTAATEEQCKTPELPSFYSSSVKPYTVNGGLYFIRASAKVLNVFMGVVDSYATNKIQDQALINERFSKDPSVEFRGLCKDQPAPKNPSILTFCMLDNCEFSQGPWRDYESYLSSTKQRGTSQYSIHADFIVGHDSKKSAFTDKGLWMYKGENPSGSGVECAAMPKPQV